MLPIPFLFTGYSPVVAPAMWEFTLVGSPRKFSPLRSCISFKAAYPNRLVDEY
jgi:hypothetical protein